LSAAEQVRFDSGKARYMLLCIACHQPNGQGLPAVAPPLAGSEWVNGSEQRLVRMTLDGHKGPITAAGATFNLSMPAWREALDDTALSEILTFVRHEWGNDSAPVQPEVVARIRALEKDRADLWTVRELQRIRE
jgi:mono/diheme cytochrome c family protein